MQGSDQEPRTEGNPDARSRTVGEPFNPSHKCCGFYPPDIVARVRDLTDGQKRLYERAVRWAGQNGSFWYGFDTIANALGKSVRQVKDDMAVLEAKGLISHARRRRQSNRYSFLWHPIFEVQLTALQEDVLGVQESHLEVQDEVILKVQPTALESSPLESCPLNSAKADIKLIPGDASQKPRAAAGPGGVLAHGATKSENPKADPSAALNSDPGIPNASDRAKGWTRGDLAEVRRRITAFWGREPEEGFEKSVMLRARGVTAAAVCELLDRKYADPNCRPGGRWAPKKQNWFLTVIENEFSPGHLPEQPAVQRPEHQAKAEEMNRGIEVIELPDAGRSIVESVQCSGCGDYILVRYTDGTIEGCRCRDRSGDTTRISPASELVDAARRKAVTR
jgi:hypothetical protein